MFRHMTLFDHMRALMVLGLPLIGGNLAQFAIGLTDTVMLGWYSIEALAAVTLAHSLFFVTFLLGAGFAWAVMPMVASYAATGNETGLRRATRMGLWLSLIYSVLSVPVFLWSEEILLAIGQQQEVAALAAEYLRVAGWAIFPALAVTVLRSYLAALERTQIILWVTLGAAVMNGLADWALIFGNWGAPELGAVGAAIASIVTNIVALAGAAIYAIQVMPEHELFVRFWRPDWEMFWRVLRMGLPIGLTSLSEVSLFAGSAMMMGWLGTLPLAAHGIAIQLASATFMLHLGLSNAATVRAGRAVGRRDRQHLRSGALAALILSLAVSLLTIVLFLSMPVQLLSLFVEPMNPDRAQILAIGVGLLTLAALFQLVDGAQVIALGLLRGAHDTAVPMIMAALSYILVGLPASYYLGFSAGFGGIGVWSGLVIGLAAAATMLLTRFWLVVLRRVG
ncbi:MAG: MATE family efflux transporter [Marinibacterium sp.]